MTRHHLLVLALVTAAVFAACGDDDPDATAAFVEPTEGDTAVGAVELAMSATGIDIEPAGQAHDGAGHFHVIADAGCLEPGAEIGKDADHVHFGGGQDEGVIYLDAGNHELCLQIGDGEHRALDVIDRVTVSVAVRSREEWCEVLTEVDDLATQVDDLEDFTETQVGFENIARLLTQLSDAIDFVDDTPVTEVYGTSGTPREHVHSTLAFFSGFARAFTMADDWDAAFATIDEIYAEAPEGFDGSLPGTDWMMTTCGVDLED